MKTYSITSGNEITTVNMISMLTMHYTDDNGKKHEHVECVVFDEEKAVEEKERLLGIYRDIFTNVYITILPIKLK